MFSTSIELDSVIASHTIEPYCRERTETMDHHLYDIFEYASNAYLNVHHAVKETSLGNKMGILLEHFKS